MHWADKIAKEIISSGKHKPYWVDDMKTASGFAHVGSMLGPVFHSLVYRALKKAGQDVTFTFVINDFDVIDGLPKDLEKDYSKYMGFPLKTAPSPVPEFKSFSDYFADDFIKSFRALGVEAETLSSWDMYHEGKFDELIRTALDNSEKIQDIYKTVSGSAKKELGWLPLQVICENCGKLGTTRVYDWDGEKVSYKCEPKLVTWAEGCEHESKISPFGGKAKLPWKVDWAAHWKAIGVTIEGAGKDHSSAGGSFDIAMAICKDVFKFPQPYKLPYEWILFGGRKMSTSKGIGMKAHDLVKILPPKVARFIFARHNYKKQTNFNAEGTLAIPDLFDEYDKASNLYWGGKDHKLAAAFEYSQVSEKTPEKHFLPRFIDVANYLQDAKIDIAKKFEEIKGGPLNELEKNTLDERTKYAKIWLADYAPKEDVFTISSSEVPEKAKSLTEAQKEYLKKVSELMEQKWENPDELQTALYNTSKEMGIPAKDAFAAIYLVLIGKPHGPKAAWFLLENLKVVKSRLIQI
ncbi:lysine--tRNA ligase [Candidatus Woesebacteria bacterium RIFCSPHIGHO2_01_FULL_44_21]|uniref:Lysine--tRNA ligase n=1 Tax=Candidatus Woesebacteria bacterium RIFCSPHIGHO2_01_FULL_44_21 TaxID=1802503 RepID=A0A1F7Z0B2_9BACT|nr:MAG: lysine--tRNA ligase [Candidatus Woesebacteria bacterium RIFCSPHIGHO2_01_FULL_44_21]OGM69221.1 MAG: lysine--tRNA ligase [Candidatus Woesebacteria bacterium RIFCSPLOWO2_01_FULL_44_24b]